MLQPTPTPTSTPPATAAPVAPVELSSLSAMPVSALPPLAPLPTSDPRSPVAVGQAVFCAVFNLAFSTLTAWLEALPQELIAKVRHTFSSSSQSPSSLHSSHSSHSSHSPNPKSALRNPQSLPERVLLACRCLYRLMCVYHTFRSAHQRITPRQLGLLGCAARAIERFSGRKFDFSCWRDCVGPLPKRYVWPDEQPAPSVSPSPSPSQSPSIPPSQISNFKSQIPSSQFPPLNLPFSAAAYTNCPILTAPGSALAQVCRDLARLFPNTGSAAVPSAPPVPFANPLPSSLTTPFTPAPANPCSSDPVRVGPCVSVPVRVGPCSSLPPSPSPSSSSSHSDACLLSPDSSSPLSFNPATDRLIVHPQWREGYTFFLRPPRITPSCFRPLRHPPP